MITWLVYVVTGKLFIYLGQSVPLPKVLQNIKLIAYWHSCDLCFGVWVYAILAYVWGLNILQIFDFTYVPVISDFITGGFISFLVHIFSIGWRTKFAPDIVL
jgi:hypothetical protein